MKTRKGYLLVVGVSFFMAFFGLGSPRPLYAQGCVLPTVDLCDFVAGNCVVNTFNAPCFKMGTGCYAFTKHEGCANNYCIADYWSIVSCPSSCCEAGECDSNCRNVPDSTCHAGACAADERRTSIKQCDGNGDGTWTNCQDTCVKDPSCVGVPPPPPTPVGCPSGYSPVEVSLTNGGFESGNLSGWTVVSGIPTVSTSMSDCNPESKSGFYCISSGPQSGSYFLYDTKGYNGNYRVRRNLSATANQTYLISAWGKGFESQYNAGKCKATSTPRAQALGGTADSGEQQVASQNGTWQNKTFLITPTTNNIQLDLWTNTNSCWGWGVIAVFDEIKAYRCEKINQLPRGWLDGADCSSFAGWAQDQDEENGRVTVKFYADGSSATGVYLGQEVADDYRQDLKNAKIGDGYHAFNFNPTQALKNAGKWNNNTHTIYAYGVDLQTGALQELLGSPKGIGPCNQPPTCSGISGPSPVYTDSQSSYTATASDPEGDTLTYSWSATCGSFPAGSGTNPVTWRSPSAAGNCTLSATVTDAKGSSVSCPAKVVQVASPTGAVSGHIFEDQNGDGQRNIAGYRICWGSWCWIYSYCPWWAGQWGWSACETIYSEPNLPDVTVKIVNRPETAVTDLSGNFGPVTLPAPATYRVQPEKSGYACTAGCDSPYKTIDLAINEQEVLEFGMRLNQPPTCSGISGPSPVYTDSQSSYTATASDPEGDTLTYSWSATCGSFPAGSGTNPVTWRSPSAAGNCTLSATVTDAKGSSVSCPAKVVQVSLAGTISGTVWEDSTPNCTIQPSESKLAGRTVNVSGTGLSAVTQTDGAYTIASVPYGTYTVCSDRPSPASDWAKFCPGLTQDADNCVEGVVVSAAAPSPTVNIGFRNVVPAWMTIGNGDVYSGRNISVSVRGGSSLLSGLGMILAKGTISSGAGGVCESGYRIANYGGQTLWPPVGSEQLETLPNWNSLSGGKSYNLAVAALNNVNYNFTGSPAVAMVYRRGDLTLTGNHFKSQSDSEKGVVLVVTGTLTIEDSVDEIDAMLIANRIVAGGTDVGQALAVKGGLAADSFLLGRSLSDNRNPAITVEFNPLFVARALQLPNLTQLMLTWRSLP